MMASLEIGTVIISGTKITCIFELKNENILAWSVVELFESRHCQWGTLSLTPVLLWSEHGVWLCSYNPGWRNLAWQPLNNSEDIAFCRSAIIGLEGCSDGTFRFLWNGCGGYGLCRPPTLPLQTVLTTQELAVLAMGTGTGSSESLVSSRGKFGLFSAPHSSSTHIQGGGMKGRWSGKT